MTSKTTNTYRIENMISGADLGTYQADDEQGALDAMARDAGCRDYAHACEVAPVAEGELRVTLVEPAPALVEFGDNQWSSQPMQIGELRAALTEYVTEVLDYGSPEQVAAIEIVTNNGIGGELRDLAAAEALVARLNTVLDDLVGGLAIREAD